MPQRIQYCQSMSPILEAAAHNLALDDELLARRAEAIRLWESPEYFVVMGRSGQAEREVDEAACAAAAVPVLRRSSGGGTVLQGPGCLNLSLILSIETRPALANIEASYEIILNRVAEALAIPGLRVEGSDLLLNDRKVSGSAQRRTKGWLLHHQTFLYAMDLDRIPRLLREPPRQPAHRRRRPHAEFLTILPLSRNQLAARLSANWPLAKLRKEP